MTEIISVPDFMVNDDRTIFVLPLFHHTNLQEIFVLQMRNCEN